jgi:hypothetical protein
VVVFDAPLQEERSMAKKAARKKIKDLSPKKKASKVKGGATKRPETITLLSHRG